MPARSSLDSKPGGGGGDRPASRTRAESRSTGADRPRPVKWTAHPPRS